MPGRLNVAAGDPVDPHLVRAWLAARSRSRGLPAPVADHGGWRVDSGEAEERRRYLFPEPGEGLRALGAAIDEPFVALKLCRPGAELVALLPPRWRLASDNVMMVCDAPPVPTRLPPGFRLALEADGPVTRARIVAADGALAAGGHAVEQDGIFIVDRIRTEPEFQRRGLGTALMHALHLAADMSEQTMK